MTIFKVPRSSRWQFEFQVEGVRYRGTTGCTNKREAQEVERKLIAKARKRHQEGYREAWTLGKLTEAYRDAVVPTLRSQEQTVSTLGKLVEWFGADTPLEEVTTARVHQVYQGRTREGYKATTVASYLGRLRVMLDWLRLTHPEVARPSPEFPKAPKSTKRRVITADEEARLLAELDPGYDGSILPPPNLRYRIDAHDLAVFLFDTGARISEAVSATWASVRWDTREIELHRIKTDTLSLLPLSARLEEVLLRRHTLTLGHPWIFPSTSEESEQPHLSTHLRSLPAAMDRAGLNAPDLVRRYGRATVHSIRHTYITRLAEAGLDPWALMQAAGHSSLQTTMGYVHLQANRSTSATRAALEAVSPDPEVRRNAVPDFHPYPRLSGTTGLPA